MSFYKINCSTHLLQLRAVSFFVSQGYKAVTLGRAVLVEVDVGDVLAKGLVMSKGYTETTTDFDVEYYKKS